MPTLTQLCTGVLKTLCMCRVSRVGTLSLRWDGTPQALNDVGQHIPGSSYVCFASSQALHIYTATAPPTLLLPCWQVPRLHCSSLVGKCHKYPNCTWLHSTVLGKRRFGLKIHACFGEELRPQSRQGLDDNN